MSWGTPTKKQQESGLTKATQELLNDVMSKRGLSMRAMQDVSESLKRGDSAWADHLNTSTATFKQPASKLNGTVKVPKYSGPQGLSSMPMPPSNFSGKRMLPDIMKVAPPERDMWVGGVPAPNRDAEKEHLSKVMEHGKKGLKDLERKQEAMREAALRGAARSQTVDPREEKINQIVEEVRERREFLEEMQAAGRAAQYEATIKGEIAVRLKELERLGLDVKSSRPQQQQQVLDPKALRLG